MSCLTTEGVVSTKELMKNLGRIAVEDVTSCPRGLGSKLQGNSALQALLSKLVIDASLHSCGYGMRSWMFRVNSCRVDMGMSPSPSKPPEREWAGSGFDWKR